jgi:hypothetical protein
VSRLYFNSQELASKYFLQFRMRMASLPNDIKNDTRKLQIIGSYIKRIILCAINSSLKKSGKSYVSRIEVVNFRGYQYCYMHHEMGEH